MEELLIILADEWTPEQLTSYIIKLEARVLITKELIKELKVIRRNKSRRKPVDTGSPRGGK